MKPHIEPDRAALEIAHYFLDVTMSVDQMLAHKQFGPILKIVARRHMERRDFFDAKKAQANDF